MHQTTNVKPKIGKEGQIGSFNELKGVKINGSEPTVREHLTPGAQFQGLTKDPTTGKADYRNQGPEYFKDDVYLNPTEKAAAKTHEHGSVPSDNARTTYVKELQSQAAAGKGPGANLNEHLLSPSIQHAVETGTPTDVANKAALGQAGKLFSLQRLKDTAQKLAEFAKRSGSTVQKSISQVADAAAGAAKTAGKATKVLGDVMGPLSVVLDAMDYFQMEKQGYVEGPFGLTGMKPRHRY